MTGKRIVEAGLLVAVVVGLGALGQLIFGGFAPDTFLGLVIGGAVALPVIVLCWHVRDQRHGKTSQTTGKAGLPPGH